MNYWSNGANGNSYEWKEEWVWDGECNSPVHWLPAWVRPWVRSLLSHKKFKWKEEIKIKDKGLFFVIIMVKMQENVDYRFYKVHFKFCFKILFRSVSSGF